MEEKILELQFQMGDKDRQITELNQDINQIRDELQQLDGSVQEVAMGGPTYG